MITVNGNNSVVGGESGAKSDKSKGLSLVLVHRKVVTLMSRSVKSIANIDTMRVSSAVKFYGRDGGSMCFVV